MTWAYGLMELAATAIEGVTILCAVTHISCERYFGRRHKSLILLLAFIYTVIITAMNSFSAFSFVTIGIAVTLIVWSSYFTSKGSLLLRSTSAVISIPSENDAAAKIIKKNNAIMLTPIFKNPMYSSPAPGIRENRNLQSAFFLLVIFWPP